MLPIFHDSDEHVVMTAFTVFSSLQIAKSLFPTFFSGVYQKSILRPEMRIERSGEAEMAGADYSFEGFVSKLSTGSSKC